MHSGSTLEAILKRDRAVVIGALAVVVTVSWLYLLAGAGMGMSALEMTRMTGGVVPDPGGSPMAGESATPGESMDAQPSGGAGSKPAGMSMAQPAPWTPAYAVLMFFMWWVMMIAMMLPSASPMILLHAAVARKAAAGHPGRPGAAMMAGLFVAGYLAAWGGFSALATAAQWGLQRTGLLSGMMASTSVLFGAGLLIAAGVYQLTPLKQACLRHCRSPMHFVIAHWRRGPGGAFKMGAHHGLFCLGCCWFLMLLLFYGGVMNLLWIIGLALFVLLEKCIPAGHWLGRCTGVVLAAWGSVLIVLNAG